MIDILRIRRNFLFLQWGFHILLYCLFLLFDLEKEANLLFVISFWYTISYAYILYAEIKYSLDFNPFQILILSSIQFVGLNGISMYLNILEGEEYKFGIYFINNYLQIGAYFYHCNICCFIMAYALLITCDIKKTVMFVECQYVIKF